MSKRADPADTLQGSYLASVAETLVTLSDIGRAYGVTRQAVHKWAARDTFPPPRAEVAKSRVWYLREVEDWHRRYHRNGEAA